MAALTVHDRVLARPPDLSTPGDRPSHARISAWLERLITSNRLHPGDRLPPEVEMAQSLGVSRMTLRQGLADIERKGLLERRRGRLGGSFIAAPRVEITLAARLGFTEQMRRAHVAAGARVVQANAAAPSDEVRTALALRRNQKVFEILRVRSANGEPVALEQLFVPAAAFPGLLDLDLTGSVYTLMIDHFGTGPQQVEETIEPARATSVQAGLLGVRVDASLLLVTRTSFAASGTPIELSHDYFRPDRTRLTVRTSPQQAGFDGLSPAT